MRRITLLALVLMSFMAFQLVSAEILLFQPTSVYNYGDTITLTATVKESAEKSGFLEISLDCLNISKNLHKEYLSLPAGSQKSIQPVSIPLSKSFLSGLNPESCIFKASFADESASTQSFRISSAIVISLSSSNISFYPGQSFLVRGTASKEIGNKVNGFVEGSVQSTNLQNTGEVIDGSFVLNFSFPSDIQSGNYLLNVRVYETGKEGGINNEGTSYLAVSINALPSKMEIAIDKQEITPGETFTFKPIIYDQAGDLVYQDASVKILDVKGNILYQEIIRSGTDTKISLETTAPNGEWNIEAKSSDLSASRFFNVLELQKAKFDIRNSTLIITNLGNVPYTKPIKITLGDKEVVLDSKIDISQSERIDLSKYAPSSGEYNVSVSDSIVKESSKIYVEKKSGFFGATGAVVSSGTLNFVSNFPIVWLFLIVVFGLFIYTMMQRTIQRRFMGYASEDNSKKEEKEQPRVISSTELIQKNVPAEKAEHALVKDGRREEVSLVNVKIKNMSQVGKDENGTLAKIKSMIKDHRGVVYENQDFIIGMFSAITTRTFKNEIPAIKLASQLDTLLKEHNKKFNNKLDYGVSAHQGALILKKEGSTIKFTGVENTLPLVKKISDIAQQELLLSENIYKKAANEIKANKSTIDGLNIYRIVRIAQRDDKFINGFLDRQQKDRIRDLAKR